jgi:hypothetical protein
MSGFRRNVDERGAVLGVLCSVVWKPFTDVSGQRIGPILKGQEAQEYLYFLTLEDGTDTLSRNVGKVVPLDAA